MMWTSLTLALHLILVGYATANVQNVVTHYADKMDVPSNWSTQFSSTSIPGAGVSGCKTIGKYETDPRSNDDWATFKRHLEAYSSFHHRQLLKLKSGDRTVRTLTWSCFRPVSCCGIGDQLYNIQQALVYAIVSGRVLSLYWNPTSRRTMRYLQPHEIDWTYFNESLGMTKYHSNDQYRRVQTRTVEYYEPFYAMLLSENHHHLTVNHELQVPFIRGIRMAMTSSIINETLVQFGITTQLTDNFAGVPLEIFSGELLRYLFRFEKSVVDKAQQIERQLGLFDQPYLALHIRTGFLGMKQDEGFRFNSRKAFRNSTAWNKTIACSVKLTNKLFGMKQPIYLATDSDKVKELALTKHGQRIKTVNFTLQHVALTKLVKSKRPTKRDALEQSNKLIEQAMNDGKEVEEIDGYLATWVDFLLMARAPALVHSISGFSVTAGQFCSIRQQYLLPYCAAQTKRKQK